MGESSFYARYWSQGSDAIPNHDPLTPNRARHVMTLLDQSSGRRVVDAGCGSGLLTRLYANVADEVIGLDVSAEGIAMAGEALPSHVTLKQADLESSWPVEDGWADVVVSSEVIEHLFEFPRYVAEAARVLKPGGTLYLTTPFHGRLKNLVLALKGFDRHYCDYTGGHIRFFTNNHLAALAEANGLTSVRFESLGRIPALAKSTVMWATKAV